MRNLLNITFLSLIVYIGAIMIKPDLAPGFIPDMECSYELGGWLILGRDKIGHFFLMGLAALSLNVLLKAKEITFRGSSFLLGSIIIALIVTLEELRQIPLPHRNFEIFDIFYNFAGIFILGRIGAWLVRKLE